MWLKLRTVSFCRSDCDSAVVKSAGCEIILLSANITVLLTHTLLVGLLGDHSDTQENSVKMVVRGRCIHG